SGWSWSVCPVKIKNPVGLQVTLYPLSKTGNFEGCPEIAGGQLVTGLLGLIDNATAQCRSNAGDRCDVVPGKKLRPQSRPVLLIGGRCAQGRRQVHAIAIEKHPVDTVTCP